MSWFGAVLRPSYFRVLLRGSLLGGAILDLGLALYLLGGALGLNVLSTGAPDVVYHGWLIVPPLAARGVVELLACYDLERYDVVIPWTGMTLIGGAILALLLGPGWSFALSGPAVLGGGQILGWKASRA